MNKDDESQQATDTAFIEESLKQLHLSTDRELEVLADLYKNTLSRARQGAQPLSAFARAKIWDLRGYQWASNALLDLFGEKGRAWAESENRRRQRRAAKKIAKEGE